MSRYARHHPDQPDTWDNPPMPVPAFPGPCRCSHPESMHYRDRRGRPTCGSAVCGCTQYRPQETT